MREERWPDILIAGAGIAGCALACTLEKKGYDVLMVERAPGPRRMFKGEYLQPGAVQYLESIGLGGVFNVPSSSAVTNLRFRDVDSRGEVVSSIVMDYPAGSPARSIELFDLLSGLTDCARRALGDRFWQGTELFPVAASGTDLAGFSARPEYLCKRNGVDVLIRPRWTIGCDGRQSAVRRWIGGRRPLKNSRVTVGAQEEFILGAHLGDLSDSPERYEVVRTHRHGTVSMFGLGSVGKRVYLGARVPDSGDAGFAVAFRKALAAAQPALALAQVPERLTVSGYPANSEWYGPSSNGRVFLAGDALAVTSPYGGQGMTLALENVRFLSEEIDWRDDSSVQAAKPRYAKYAADSFERVQLLNFGLYYAFFARPAIFKRSTRLILRSWEKNPDLKDRVSRLFAGLDRDIPTILEILDLEHGAIGASASRFIQGALQWA